MTKNTMAIQALLNRSADADFLRDVNGFAAQQLMDLEVRRPDRRRLWREERRAPRPA